MSETQQKKKVEVLVINLADRRDSTWTLQGTEGTATPQTLNAPATYDMLNTSYMRDENGNNIPIRYIYNCNEILVSEQKKLNITPNPAYDFITFTNGSLTVVNEGPHKGLFKFLKACQGNGSNKDRVEEERVVFEELDIQGSAKMSLDVRFEHDMARGMLRELMTRTHSGYEFKEEKIDYLCSLFSVGDAASYEEKMEALSLLADENPIAFRSTIADVRSSVRADIAIAQQMSVITVNKDNAVFNDGGKILLEFDSRSDNKKNEEFIEYLLSSAGSDDYKTLKQRTIAAKMVAAEK